MSEGYAVESTLELARRVLDYHAFVCREFYDECIREGDDKSELMKRYASQYNSLVDLRGRFNQEFASQMLRWDGPEAKEKIWIE